MEKLRGTLQNAKESAWVSVNKRVYDVTQFVDHHPGGKQILCFLLHEKSLKHSTFITLSVTFPSNSTKVLHRIPHVS